MQAVWYDRQGAAEDVLQVGTLADPVPRAGEVRVALTRSGISQGDIKKRAGWLGSGMAFPRIVPHSDGAGVVDAVGDGVDPSTVGRRVWVWGAQSYRPSGTAAQLVVVPQDHAVPLPDSVSDDVGACLGIPGITAHRAVFADGPVDGKVVLVQGALGTVGSMAASLALRGGATVIATVVHAGDLEDVPAELRQRAVALDSSDPAAAIRALAPDGVDRVVEVALSSNAELDAAVAREGTTIAAYATRADPTSIPFWSMAFDNVVVRLLGSDDFPLSAKLEAARTLTEAAAAGDLPVRIGRPFDLSDTAAAEDAVDAGSRDRILVRIPRA